MHSNNIKIGIASDHRGFTAKEFLKEYFDENDIYVIDFGTNSAESVDFPVYAKKLGEAIQNEEIDLGIAICGTGIGMSIVLNKMKGVYCAKVSNESEKKGKIVTRELKERIVSWERKENGITLTSINISPNAYLELAKITQQEVRIKRLGYEKAEDKGEELC